MRNYSRRAQGNGSAGIDTSQFRPSGELAKIQDKPKGAPIGERNLYGAQDPLNTVFPSIAEMAAWLTNALGNERRVNMDHPGHDHAWTWGYNTHQAIRSATEGWPEGARVVGASHVDVANAYLSEHTEESTRYDVSGAFVDVATFLEGSPECMVDFCEEKRETRSVRIDVDGYVSAAIGADEIFARGIAIMGAVLAVQASGIAVTLDMSIKQDLLGVEGVQRVRVTLHAPGDEMDTSRLAFYLSHPAFVRLFFIGGSWVLAGASNSMRETSDPTPSGTVYLTGMMLDDHPWGTPEANKALIEKIFAAAI